MASVQPKTTEHVYPIRTLQDGRNECGNANAAEKRLDVLNRHKRRILRSSNYITTQEIPAVCLGYKTTRVSVPTVWIELSTSSIYQTSTPSSGTSSLGGDLSSDLLGRYHNSESITGCPNTGSQHDTLVITGPRFCDKLGEISHTTDTADRISSGINKHTGYGTLAARGESSENTQEMLGNFNRRENLCQTVITFDRHTKHLGFDRAVGTAPLQETPNAEIQRSLNGQSEIRHFDKIAKNAKRK